MTHDGAFHRAEMEQYTMRVPNRNRPTGKHRASCHATSALAQEHAPTQSNGRIADTEALDPVKSLLAGELDLLVCAPGHITRVEARAEERGD